MTISALERALTAGRFAFMSASDALLGDDAEDAFWEKLPREQFRTMVAEAGRFLLANRDAPADAVSIHLAMAGLGGTLKPGKVENLLWTVFRSVFLAVYDHLDAEERARNRQPFEQGTGFGGEPGYQQTRPGFDSADGYKPSRPGFETPSGTSVSPATSRRGRASTAPTATNRRGPASRRRPARR